jgi:hypothetical protein
MVVPYSSNRRPPRTSPDLVHRNAHPPQLGAREVDLAHELRVRRLCVVEREHAPAEAEEEQRTERDEDPKGEDRDDCSLDDGREGNQLEVEGQVELCDERRGVSMEHECGDGTTRGGVGRSGEW